MSTTGINELLIEARTKLMEFAARNRLNEEMATTFSLLLMYPEKAFIAWCGDTRVYHLRAGKILFKTEDHSLVNALKKEGEITEEEARLHPQKNIILRAIKADGSPIDADSHWIEELQEGDYFLLCTDGVLENISDDDIQSLLSENDTAKTDLAKSFQALCYGRTRDNYSMYLVRLGVMAAREKKSSLSISRILVILAVLLTFVLMAVYFKGRTTRNSEPVRKDSATQTLIQSSKHDSLPYVEIEGDETDSEKLDSAIHAQMKAKDLGKPDSNQTR
jgi:protein phosphatase